jgi:hypothetical protein
MSGNAIYQSGYCYPRNYIYLARNMTETNSQRTCTMRPLETGVPMSCKSCGSINQKKFVGEIAIHSPGLKGIDKPIVWVFPELVVCLECGFSEFAVPGAQLRLLAKGDAAAAG